MAGLILSAPASGAGKTTITLGLLRALKRRGVDIRAAKSGPDYIDPRFHEAACGRTCRNLDAWAMTPDRVRALAAGQGPLLIEGAMGLFDGAPPDGKGATADLARILGLPVVLVVDAARMAQSVVPIVQGFAAHDAHVPVAGVILNRVGSDRHEVMLRRALDNAGVRVFGAIHRAPGLAHPSRHLGLVQAQERDDLEAFIDAVADIVAGALDIEALLSAFAPLPAAGKARRMAPPAQRISIAQDAAFAFAYPHIVNDWRAGGAKISYFSPLADEAPARADLIFLPGGYPELYAGRLAGHSNFMNGLKNAAEDTVIYGECGGYMVLGDGLVDADGRRHQMAGLLALETSFETRKLHLGYRALTAQAGPFAGRHMAHEFHYATTLRADGVPLFQATDAEGNTLPPMGLARGTVSGSFAHIIDCVD